MRVLMWLNLMLLVFITNGCGQELMNYRGHKLTAEEAAAVEKKKIASMEASLNLEKDLDLTSLNFNTVSSAVSQSNLHDYMTENNLRAALLIFCKEDNAVCRMVSRDLLADPIGNETKDFGVIGVLVDAAKKPDELPEYFKFDDSQGDHLSQTLMLSPDKDVVPYFVLVFKGETKQGIMTRLGIDLTTHAELKSRVVTQLAKLGVKP